jgi:hypothetical protein
MTKHKHARAKTPWSRTTRGRLAAAVLLIGTAVGVRVATTDDDKADPLEEVSGARPATDGITWVAQDGSAYRMTVTPSSRFVNAASPSGCITVPPPGTTNLRFTVTVQNRTPRATPVPGLEFAANLAESGAVHPGLTFAEASKRIEVLPLATARTCDQASRVDAGAREPIPPGESITFTGTLAGVRTPLDESLALLVRYSRADASAPDGSELVVATVPFAAS